MLEALSGVSARVSDYHCITGSDGQVQFQTAKLNHEPLNQTPPNQTTLNCCLGFVLGSPPQDFYLNQFGVASNDGLMTSTTPEHSRSVVGTAISLFAVVHYDTDM